MRRLILTLVLLTTTAWASAPTAHELWVRAALGRVPASKMDRTAERADLRAANLDVFAVEIARVSAKAPLEPRRWAALLGAVGGIESNFDTDIVAGRCRPSECDSLKIKGAVVFRAVGAFQQHDVSFVHDLWSTAAGNIPAQVEMADRAFRRSLTRCAPFAPFPNHIFRAYRGGSCSWPVHREAERVAAYVRLLSTPSVKQ